MTVLRQAACVRPAGRARCRSIAAMIRRIPQWALAFFALAGLGMLLGGAVLASRLGPAWDDERVYEAAPICAASVPPAAAQTACRSQMPATVVDRKVVGSKSPSYDVEVILPSGATQWAGDVRWALYRDVGTGSPVQVRLWRGSITWIEDPFAVISTTDADPGGQARNDALGAWFLGMGGLLLLGYAALGLRRNRRRDAIDDGWSPADPDRTCRPVPTLGSALWIVTCSVYVCGGLLAAIPRVSTIAGVLAAGLAGVGAGAALCAVLRLSAALTLTPTGFLLSRWGGAPMAADFASIHWVRRGRSLVLTTGDQTVPIAALRIGTAANEPAIVGIITKSGAGWAPQRPGATVRTARPHLP
jgi:hypothetical protein